MNLTILINSNQQLDLGLGEYFTNAYQRFNIIPDKDELISIDPGSGFNAGIYKVNAKAYTITSDENLLVKLIITKIQ